MTEQQKRREAMHEVPHRRILRLMIKVRGRDAWERRGGAVHPTGRQCARAAVWTGGA